MNYLSLCSGIEAASVAWHPLGWNPLAFSEIEKFPSQVLEHHYPHVPNLGDMTKYKEWKLNGTVDLLVGGTPCQSFSVAGLRKGLDDPRGNLMLTYLAIAARNKPKWIVWENVPGVLSSNGGEDFATFLRGLGELGYGFAYRVLDAQYFGVAQRRRRVFVVGCLGDWRSAATVLFDSASLSGNPPPSREKGKETTTSFVPSLANCLQTTSNDYSRADGFNMICTENTEPLTARHYKEISLDDCNPTMMKLVGYSANICPTITNSGAGFSRVGNEATEAETYVVTSFSPSHFTRGFGMSPTKELSGTIKAEMNDNSPHVFVAQPIAWDAELNAKEQLMGTLLRGGEGGRTEGVMQTNMAVRRLTPIECERLQGFPENYTNIKTNCPDGPRYKALGNSMAVPVMCWIGKRINLVEEITCQ
jgi:DNA (cytosine-5)-methyltransferase 1